MSTHISPACRQGVAVTLGVAKDCAQGSINFYLNNTLFSSGTMAILTHSDLSQKNLAIKVNQTRCTNCRSIQSPRNILHLSLELHSLNVDSRQKQLQYSHN